MNRLILIIAFLFSCSFYACAQKKPIEKLSERNRLQSSIVLLNNEDSIIPLKGLETRTIGSINADVPFDSILNKYEFVQAVLPGDDAPNFNTLIVQVNDRILSDSLFISSLKNYTKTKQLVISGIGSMKNLAKLNDIRVPIIWSEDTSRNASIMSAEIIFGGVAAKGRLQKTISPYFKIGSGYSTVQSRLLYSNPEAVGIDGKKLTKDIDAIAKEMIEGKAAPGAVVMIVKDNNVIFEKAYGNHYYNVKEPVKVTDIFDMASVSKIAATTLAVMHLEEENKIDLNKTIGDYLKDAQSTNKKDIKLRDVMLHQAGLVPFIPFYRDLTKNDFRTDSSAAFPVKVAENYFLRKGYFEDVMWPAMLKSSVKPTGKYVYSDLSMYIMQHVVEAQSKMSLDQYVQKEFYDKLGMYSTGYNPWKRFPSVRIVPTELDKTFRKSQLIGYVHDQGAAMAGGVAGHAGLFSTANDLAIYGQLLLNKGTYGGEQYFKPATVEKYTKRYSESSRRGLGFDKWDPDATNEYPSKLAPPSIFGHTGYTGTAIWMDPDQQLIYIFLSNRVQPDVSPYLSKLEIRSRILDVIYKALPKK